VAAREEGSHGGAGISLFAVPAAARGVSRRLLPTLDPTRRLAQIELDRVRVPLSARLGEEGGGAAALARSLDLAAIALAAEQVGGAQRCLDLAVAHAKGRVQFGRPIGSFQAIQHRCADMMLRVESARSAAYYAACVAAEGGADLARVASLAKATCSEAYFQCAADCLQIHGGVGFTWEVDVHLHLKRARAGEGFLGTPAWHRERVAQLIGL
jgi:alkylation response protein AidB-like acyl-CoA dehydrogenase